MNPLGIVQTGVIVAVHFSQHGDAPLSIVKVVLQNLGYGIGNNEHRYQSMLDAMILLDQGYHIASIIKLLIQIKQAGN